MSGIRVRRHWRPPIALPVCEANVAREFTNRLRNSLASSLEICSTPAVALSGGLDSSSILRAVDELHPPRVIALSFHRQGYAFPDELGFAQAAVSGSSASLLVVDQEVDFDLASVLGDASEPESIERMPLLALVARKASDVGCPMVLTGAFGDVVAGYRGGLSATRMPSTSKSSHVQRVARQLLDRYRAPALARKRTAELSTFIDPTMMGSLASRFAAESTIWRSPDTPLQTVFANYLPAVVCGSQRVSRLIEHITGADIVHPFADPQLVELGSVLPDHYRWGREGDRVALRQAMAELLPDSVRLRTRKSHYSQFFGRFFRDALATEVMKEQPPAFGELLRKNWAQTCDNAGRASHSVLRSVFRLGIAGAWLRQLAVGG